MQRIGLVLPPGFQVMSFAPISVFEVANVVLGEALYEVHALSPAGGRIPNTFGMMIDTEPLAKRHFDTLLLGSGAEIRPAAPELLRALRRCLPNTRRMAAICIGAFTLGEAGLLDGRRATTHWAHAPLLQERFPRATVEMDRMFIADGPIWTSAGMTAGIDMALSLVEADIGAEKARAVARLLVVYHRRTGGQSQHSAVLELGATSDRVQDALEYAKKDLTQALSVTELAQAARLSPRQFSRVFRTETGVSPAKAIESIRLEAARIMVEQGRRSLDEIARACGFGDCERMRRSFLRVHGQTPRSLRNAATPIAEPHVVAARSR